MLRIRDFTSYWPTDSPKPNSFSFNIINDKEKKNEILTFKKPEQANVPLFKTEHYCPNNRLSISIHFLLTNGLMVAALAVKTSTVNASQLCFLIPGVGMSSLKLRAQFEGKQWPSVLPSSLLE